MSINFCEKNSEFYDLEYYLSLEYRQLSGAHLGYTKNFLKTLKKLDLKGRRVLDVGCGGGFLTQKIAELGAEVIGCDYSPFAVKFAKERYPNLNIIQRSAYEIDKLGINNLDFIFALDVVEHLGQPEIFFEKALKILRPKDGRLLITTDNENYLFKKVPFNHLRNVLMRTSQGGRAQRLIGKVERYRRQFKNYHRSHINLASAEIWIERIKKAGFEIERVLAFSNISIPFLDAFCKFLPLFSRGDHVLIIARVNQRELKIDIGCGRNKRSGYVGIDIDKNSDADMIASALDLPFKDSSVAEINCSHLVEHFSPSETQRFFDEIHRVLKRGGNANLKIDRDWTKSRLLQKDPSHKHRYTAKEFKKMLGKFSQKEVKDKIYFFRWNKPRRKIFVKLVK